jgi:dipeptidyl aminopeptidase/acylaminoacyl peptidase
MQKDMRDTACYREAESLYTNLRQPGSGLVSDAVEIHASPTGKSAVLSGTLVDKLEGSPTTRICQIDLTSGYCQVLTSGGNTDRLAKYSPDGRTLAFLSDRLNAGDFQLHLIDLVTGAIRRAPAVEGWIEYLHWSPDGARILLGVAGYGADISGGQGAITSNQVVGAAPSWMPAVETGDESYRWRRLWVYEVASNRARQVSQSDSNVWEAVWCGDASIAAIISPGPGEGLWYSARLYIVELETGISREIYASQDQLGWPTASPAGNYLAIVEAVCSDRGIVAGKLRLIDTSSGEVRRVDTQDVDITCTEWRSDRTMLLAGHRGFETVVGLYDAKTHRFMQTWASRELTTGGRYASVSGINDRGNCVLIGESFMRAPEVAVIREGSYRTVKSFDVGYADEAASIGTISGVRWQAADGLAIQGWLLQPTQAPPHPLVMNIHGGPVWHWRPMWLGRPRTAPLLMLIQRGYAVFLPNPRGSSGRGEEFARRVKGDINGADARDLLSGLDSLVERGIADASRIGATGISYGGGMTSWLITQDSRFAAAVSVSPHNNLVSMHLLSNIPHFVAAFMDDHYSNPGGKYFERSPIMHAHEAKTPTLNICGALDRCTPPEEAVQFHNALTENGVTSVLVTYPEEGHGIERFPATIDYAARVVAWFDEYMPAE